MSQAEFGFCRLHGTFPIGGQSGYGCPACAEEMLYKIGAGLEASAPMAHFWDGEEKRCQRG
jgi:hypothetical protein